MGEFLSSVGDLVGARWWAAIPRQWRLRSCRRFPTSVTERDCRLRGHHGTIWTTETTVATVSDERGRVIQYRVIVEDKCSDCGLILNRREETRTR